MRRAARTDATQTAIIDALTKCGVSVEIIKQPVDLMVCCRGETSLVECKSLRPTSDGGSHGLTEYQKKFLGRWPGKVHIVRNADEAVRAVLGERVMA